MEANNRNIFVNGPGSFDQPAPQLRAEDGPQNGGQGGLFNRIQNGVLSGAQSGVNGGSPGAVQNISQQSAIRNGAQNGGQNGVRNGINATHAARLQPVRTPGSGGPQLQHTQAHVDRPMTRASGTTRRPNSSPAQNLATNQRLRGEPNTGEFVLSMAWRTLRLKSLRVAQGSTPKHPAQKLQEIMAQTGAYLQSPGDNETKILIWGTPEQVENAKAELTQFESDAESAPRDNHASWYKGFAVDGRAEHRQERLMDEKRFVEALKLADLKYPIEGGLLWSKLLDGNEFCKDNSEALDDLRRQFSCKIEFCQAPGEFSWMKICVTRRKQLVVVISRITNIAKEHIARRDQLVKLNLIRYPSFGVYRQEVKLLERDPTTKSYLPTLHGAPHPDEEAWKQLQSSKHLVNRRKVKATLDRTLKSLAISQRHVRMRVAFGEVGFVQFQKPPNGAQSYQFDEFHRLVTQGRTKVNLNNLPVRQGIENLGDVLNSMDAFTDQEITYGAFFDFAGKAKETNSLIRLECVFGRYGEDTDFEIQEQRWVEVNDMVGRCQMTMIDFERPDYQFTIDAFPLYENRLINREQSVFQTNVSFKPHDEGLKAPPRMRVKFPPTTANLDAISEITTIKWRFKQTDGIFELRRKDVYEYGPGRRAGLLHGSRWHAIYYYPEWDNLMSEFASLKPGETVKWFKTATTFFPEDEGDSGLALPKGFKNFMAEVEDVQDLLAEAISQIARDAHAPETNGAVNGTDEQGAAQSS